MHQRLVDSTEYTQPLSCGFVSPTSFDGIRKRVEDQVSATDERRQQPSGCRQCRLDTQLRDGQVPRRRTLRGAAVCGSS